MVLGSLKGNSFLKRAAACAVGLASVFAADGVGAAGETGSLKTSGFPSLSFRYADADSSAFVAGDVRAEENERWTKRVETWLSPDRLLKVRLTRKQYRKFPVQEWLPELIGVGEKPTAIVADFKSADFTFPGAVGVRALTGTKCTPADFTPVGKSLGEGKDAAFSMAATEGRSSADWFPFWGVDCADGSGKEFAIGWSGAWRADFTATNGAVRMTAGLLKTHFRVLPGETLRLPSMLVFDRGKEVDPVAMQTVIHRFMMDEKSPRDSKGRLIEPLQPLTAGGGNKTPEKMKGMIDWAVREKMLFNCFWVDAGWNGPPHQPDMVSNCGEHWWKYVGLWDFNPTVHPKGNLREVSDHAAAHGMKMLLWVEPERYSVGYVKPKVFLEHRDWFLPSVSRPKPWGDNYLLNLGNPAACDFLIDQISGIVRENNLGVYRQDFNFNVLAHWTEEEENAPDRVGVTEMKYVAGLYRFWDTLRERFPDLLIENCASGGRRLDFEAISRSHSYCRTDYVIGFKGNVVQVTDAQNCTYNTLAYQPFQGGETRPAAMFDDYGWFSATCAGSVFTPSDWGGGLVARDFTAEETAWLREMLTVTERMRLFYLGDYYPLAGGPMPQDESRFCAWQLHRPDRDAGFALVFRRLGVDARRFTCALKGIDPAATYGVEFFREAPRTMKGAELAALVLDLPQPRSFKQFFYSKVGNDAKTISGVSPWRACVADDGGAYFRETVMTPAKTPVSFTYGGREHIGLGVGKVLERTLETKGVETTGRLRVQVDESLVVELEGAYRADFGESEWVLWFENPGTKPSKELSDVVCLRYDFQKCSEEWTCPRLRGIRGDHENLYRPYEIDCWNHPNGYRINGESRPTHVEFPYFDLFTKEGGLLCALGWAGTWRADFDNVRDCPRPDWRFRVSFRACPSFSSVLLPGERIRSARVVLIPHKGSDIDHVSNLWRAWFRKYNEPKANAAGKALRPLSTANFAADTGKPNSDGSISEGHDTWRPTFEKIVAEKVAPDFRWFDAGWYVDPRGKSIPSVWWDVGTWTLDSEKWPDGSLRASVDAGHAVGMKTLVWFEPERVCDPPALVTNFGYRAEWALPYGPCFWRKEAVVAWNDIGDPQCFAWTRDRILAMMEANGIDLYREDHNFAPGSAWAEGDRRAEAKLKLPRRGMTETKGVMGHWALWDAIVGHGRQKGRCTFVDSCASGGGRNDLESLRRGVPLHRSDSDQATAGLRLSMTSSFCRWIPFHGACTKDVEGDYVVDDGPGASPYVFRASFLPVLNYGTRFVQNRNLDFALLRRNLAEWRSVADLLLKDFYVLTSWHPGDDRSVWTVLAYDDPEKGESIILAFRQEEASYPSFEAVLKFADPACDYEIVDADTGRRETVSGKDLRTRGHFITLPQRKSSALLRLRRLK